VHWYDRRQQRHRHQALLRDPWARRLAAGALPQAIACHFAINRSVAGCIIKPDCGAHGTCHSVASGAAADSPTISLTDAARLTRSTWFAKNLYRLW